MNAQTCTEFLSSLPLPLALSVLVGSRINKIQNNFTFSDKPKEVGNQSSQC